MNDIWKVFYKTDKSRTRESNNFGVGLSIVKTTVELHNGKVNVMNKDKGVEFSFWLPL
jgi:signal transduction histidine kinase